MEPTVSGGIARLQLDTFNPSAITPGDSFFGTEIVSNETYLPGGGIQFEARVRLDASLPGGLVGAFFLFEHRPIPGLQDEIDFELLSNEVVIGDHRVLTNVYDDEPATADTDTELQTSAGHDIYRGDLLGETHRLIERQHQNAGGKLHMFGLPGEPGNDRKR